MKIVTLERSYKVTCTRGIATLPGGRTIHTIELPWKNNQQNISCYPPGVYLCKYIERSASGKFKRCWHVQNVPNRVGILWHVANYKTLGCTLPGLKAGFLDGKPAALSSLAAMNILRAEMSGEDFILVVA